MKKTARIEEQSRIMTLINTFEVAPENQERLIASLREVTENVMSLKPGFVGASVHRGIDGKHVANYVQWETEGDFEAAFGDPRMQAHLAELRTIALSVQPLVYVVAYVGAA